MLKILRNFINGLIFGAIQIVPGISGATIAIMLGFYFDFLSSINNFFKDFKRNMFFLLPLITGIALGLLVFSSIIHFLLTNYNFPTMMFFVGLITGTMPLFYRNIRERGRRIKLLNFVLILVPFVILLFVSLIGTENNAVFNSQLIFVNYNIPFMMFLFFAGLLSAISFIIPGFSGSFVLLLMGVYGIVIYSISSIGTYLSDITDVDLLLNILRIMLPLGVGILCGLIIMARIMQNLFKRHKKQLYSCILGLILGSLWMMFSDTISQSSSAGILFIIIGIAAFFSGAVLSFIAGRKNI